MICWSDHLKGIQHIKNRNAELQKELTQLQASLISPAKDNTKKHTPAAATVTAATCPRCTEMKHEIKHLKEQNTELRDDFEALLSSQRPLTLTLTLIG